MTDTSNAGEISFTFGTKTSGGGAARFALWNAYNRVDVGTNVIDSGTSYTYTSATIRQARASAGNEIQFVIRYFRRCDRSNRLRRNTNYCRYYGWRRTLFGARLGQHDNGYRVDCRRVCLEQLGNLRNALYQRHLAAGRWIAHVNGKRGRRRYSCR